MKIIERIRAIPKCTRAVVALFGWLFLMALFFVPVTTVETRMELRIGDGVYVRKTIPRNSYMFLPSYLKAVSQPKNAITPRSTQWYSFMGIVAIVGFIDYFLFCRFLRRRRGP